MPAGMFDGPASRIRFVVPGTVTAIVEASHFGLRLAPFVVIVLRMSSQQPIERIAGSLVPALSRMVLALTWKDSWAGMPTWSIPVTSPFTVATSVDAV